MVSRRSEQSRTTRAREGTRRSRLAAWAGCALSLFVHGSAVAVLSVAGRSPTLAAPLDDSLLPGISDELVAISVTVEGVIGELTETRTEAPAIQPHLVSVRRRIAREPLVPPLREPTVSLMVPEVEPAPPLSPPPVARTPSPARVLAPEEPPGQMVPPEIARALRIYDFFPSMAMKLVHGRADVDVRICVSEQGTVSDASIQQPAPEALGETLRAAILKWRYRPLTVNGRSMPFCHLIRFSYRSEVGS
jgi:TonB family protein